MRTKLRLLISNKIINIFNSKILHPNLQAEEILSDLESNGIIVPPCQIGSTIYCLVFHRDRELKQTVASHYTKDTVIGIHICDSRLKKNYITNSKYKNYLIIEVGDSNTIHHVPIDKIGKTVFLDEESVKEALEVYNGNL